MIASTAPIAEVMFGCTKSLSDFVDECVSPVSYSGNKDNALVVVAGVAGFVEGKGMPLDLIDAGDANIAVPTAGWVSVAKRFGNLHGNLHTTR